MANTDFIDKIIAKEAYQDIEKTNALLDLLYEKFVKVAQAASQSNDAIGSADGLKEFTAESEKLRRETEELAKINKQLADVATKRAFAESSLVKQLAEEKILLQQANRDNANRAKIALTTAGSIARLDAVILRLQAKQRDLNLTTEDGRKKSLQYIKAIENLNNIRKKESDTIRQQQLNVGNYQGSAKIIVDALDRLRMKVQQTTQEFGAMSPEAQRATREFDALRKITDQPQFLNVAAKVGDTTRELRFFQKELIKLQNAGLQNTETYKEVEKRLAEVTDQIADTKDEIKALASDTRGFDLFAGSVTFAADAFQTLAGAAQLAGASEEDAAKATATLVAVQSVSNGVKGIANELTTKGTAANKLFAWSQGLITKAMGETTGAARVLRVALISTGILALVAIIGTLVANFGELKDRLFGVSQAQKDIAENATKAAEKEAQKLTDLEDQENVLKLQGKSEKEILRLKIGQTDEIIAQREQQLLAQQELLNGQVEAAQRNKDILKGIIDFISRPVQFLIGSIFRIKNFAENIFGRGIDPKELEKQLNEAFETTSDRMASFLFDPKQVREEGQATLDETQRIINQLKNQRAGFQLSLQQIDKKAADEQKKIAEGLAKFRLKLAEEEANAKTEFLNNYDQQVADNLQRIADDEKMSLNDRLLANTAFYKAQEELIRKKAAQEQQALLDAAKAEAESIIGRKLDPVNDADLLLEIERNTANQRILIQQKAENDIVKVRQDGLNKQTELTQNEGDRQIAIITKSAEKQIITLNKQEQDKLAALELLRTQGKISEEDYRNELEKIQADYEERRLKEELEAAKQTLKILQALGVDTTDAKQKIADIELKIAKNTTDALKKENDKRADQDREYVSKKKELFTQLRDELANTVFTFIDIGLEKQKNALEQEKNLIEEKKRIELDRISKLQETEEQKAARIQILEAKTDNQKKIIEQRQKQVEIQQAKFAKARAAFEVGINTAVAVSKVMGNPFLIALTVALGALQLATVLSTPIPQYYTGTEDSEGGLVWLGERGKELLITPQGQAYETPGTATLASIPAHSKVINNEDYMEMLRSEKANSTLKVKPMTDEQFMMMRLHQSEKNNKLIVDELVKLNNKPEAIFNISDYGIERYRKHNNSWTDYINRKVKFKP